MKKTIIIILKWILALVLLGGLGASYFLMKGQARYSVVPKLTHIDVHHPSKSEELLPKEVIIKHLPFNIEDEKLQAINTEDVETALKSNIPFIKSVNAYISPEEHQLNIDITGRKPILRFFNSDKSYFLDEDGDYLSTNSGVAVYLPIVKLSKDDEEMRKEVLLPLAQYLQEHDEWYSFFGLIEVFSPSKIHFYPRVGDYVFETIGVQNLDEDLDKIKIFYKEIVPQVGANKYGLIKLSFDNQIVCKAR